MITTPKDNEVDLRELWETIWKVAVVCGILSVCYLSYQNYVVEQYWSGIDESLLANDESPEPVYLQDIPESIPLGDVEKLLAVPQAIEFEKVGDTLIELLTIEYPTFEMTKIERGFTSKTGGSPIATVTFTTDDGETREVSAVFHADGKIKTINYHVKHRNEKSK